MTSSWPDLPYDSWADTRVTLHLWTQVVGKLKLALTPFLNEWWNVGLSLTARGLTTGPMPAGPVDLQLDFDFLDHTLVLVTSDGRRESVALRPRSVADFHAAVSAALAGLGITVRYSTRPAELPDPVPFEQDTVHDSYDPAAAARWWRAMLAVSRVIDVFRSGFGGKSSPVLFYWGGFDLNHTRFSGRPAPARPDANHVLALGEDQENLAVGFWPGSAQSPRAVLYAYHSPAPTGIDEVRVRPDSASWIAELGEFVLPWDALVGGPDPHAVALEFFAGVYDQASTLAGWNRAELDLRPAAERKTF